MDNKKQMFFANQEINCKSIHCQSIGTDQTYTYYLDLLKSQGLQVNKKCFPSIFKLKNGLQYSGIGTKQRINSNQILVRVPKKLILNSLIASKRLELKQIFKQQFYHQKWAWQYRILNTYLLYIYGKNQMENIWFHMVKHLSKNIDIVGFWSEQDLSKFKDLTIRRSAQIDRDIFQEEWQQFLNIKQKHQILQDPIFTKQNYRWIYIHLKSRPFGKKLEFLSMVPFCQFFNHHNTGVFYEVEKKNQLAKEKLSEVDDLQIDSLDSQQQQCLNQAFIQKNQAIYDKLPQCVSKKQRIKQSASLNLFPKAGLFNLDKTQSRIIQNIETNIMNTLQSQLKQKDFTIYFIAHIISECNRISNAYKINQISSQYAYEQFQEIQQSVKLYCQRVVDCYQKQNGKQYIQNKNAQNKNKKSWQLSKSQKQKIQFPQQQTQNYDHLLLVTGKNDNFFPNEQVYFCYGKDSNQNLLLYYGFTIEENKYDYVEFRFNIQNALVHFPDTLSQLEDKHLSLKKKFKLKVNKLNMELIMFFRLNSWSYFGKSSVEQLFKIKDYGKEISILIQIKESLQFRVSQFQGPHDLQDPKIGYHEYFVRVYHQQKQKILNQHMSFMSRLIGFLKSLQRGVECQKLKQQFSPQEKFIFRHYLLQF